MRNYLIYDFPQRVFHWLFAALFFISFVIGKAVDDESIIYGYHMISGFLMTGLVVFRIIWGLVGSRYSKFSSMPLSFDSLLKYFKSLSGNSELTYVGHNPASSLASIIMYICALVLFASGLQMINFNQKHLFEEIHEVVAHLFLFVVVLHIVGIAIHTFRKGELIAISMITGYKKRSNEVEDIKKNYYVVGVMLLVVFFVSSNFLVQKYDTQKGSINILNKELQLVEIEEGGEDDE